MGNEVEARTQRVRDHLQRPDHSDWQLTNARIRSTVYLTAPTDRGLGVEEGALVAGIANASLTAVSRVDTTMHVDLIEPTDRRWRDTLVMIRHDFCHLLFLR